MAPPEQLNLFEGNKRRDEGIAAAVENANRKDEKWSDRAFEFLERYIQIYHGTFMTENVRVWAYAHGLLRPPSGRAWGSVMTKAQKAGLIKFHSFGRVKNPNAHRTPAHVWIKI